ncbi:hypothetical protein I79_014295 [Cricetulus griseus]|uniref:Uncharacterized protein n=1 Tax=Cricetulus griseus TaxID=10029 RepID=G3HTR7_CRIGR|nr:hypothetical protein I79_014295 [Cricetulus griseus]
MSAINQCDVHFAHNVKTRLSSHVCCEPHPHTWEVEAKGSGVKSQTQLQMEIKASLGYMRTCLKN